MRGIFKVGVAALALAVVMAGATRSDALIEDTYTSFTQPANALVMPFDATEDWASYLLVSNIAGTSPTESGEILGVTTHWTYWSDTCVHLVDVWVCLTLNDTIVVDPTNISAIDVNNTAVGPETNLSGFRGMVVVTAYATDEICSDGSIRDFELVDHAIVGSATRANTSAEDNYSFGNDAIGLGLCHPSLEDCPVRGEYTALPKDTENSVDILTFNPKTTTASAVTFLSLQERAGSGTTANKEVGPNVARISANATVYDNMEVGTSLPDVEVRCTTFSTLEPGEGSLIPSTIDVDTSGFLRLGGLNNGGGKFVYALHGQAVAGYGASNYGKYKFIVTLE